MPSLTKVIGMLLPAADTVDVAVTGSMQVGGATVIVVGKVPSAYAFFSAPSASLPLRIPTLP